MTDHSPDAKSYRFSITSGGQSPKNYDLAVYENNVFNNNPVNIKVVYRESGATDSWKFLVSYEVYETEAMKDGDVYPEVEAIYKKISSKIRTFFLLQDDVEPFKELWEVIESIIATETVWDSENQELLLVKK